MYYESKYKFSRLNALLATVSSIVVVMIAFFNCSLCCTDFHFYLQPLNNGIFSKGEVITFKNAIQHKSIRAIALHYKYHPS